ncbi:hypothetical protein [Erwinia persicina]|uniref:hypothetical protein n=1 Tax=Erwinia persicina TaxID=55211 RepID=UPI00177B84B7|nr:hypothetical protein [Erwinia persicina]MBD8163460.1 hypothetical protein [Erwinia persicina]
MSFLLFFQMLTMLIPMSLFGISSIYLSLPIVAFNFLYNAFNRKYQKIKQQDLLLLLLAVLVLFIMITLGLIVHNSDSLDLLRMTFFGSMIFFVSFMLVSNYINHNAERALPVLMRDIFLVAVVNSFVAVLVLVSKEARELIYSVVTTSPKNELHLTIGMRSSGLFYFGGSIMSMFNFVVFYIGLAYLSNYKKKIHFYDIVMLLVVVLGTFISGRMGLIFIIALIMGVIFLPKQILKVKKSIVLKVIFFSVILFIFLVIYKYEEFRRLLNWALELFLNYINTGKISSVSTNTLETMYVLPTDILLGTGLFSQTEIGSDSGYVLLIWYFGAIAILSYLFVFFLHFMLVTATHNKILFRLFVFTLTAVLIGNFKDIYLFASNGISQIYFIMLAFALLTKNQMKQVEQDQK